MRFSSHLSFDGQCRVAFEWYQTLLGGSIRTMLSYGQSPIAAQVDPRWHDRIVHATLEVDGLELNGTDAMPWDYRVPQGFYVTLSVEAPARGVALFDALAAAGRILLPFQPTFWSPGFGVLVDQFQVPWEINTVVPAGPNFAAVTPRLPVSDVESALTFYLDRLGFSLGWKWGTPLTHANVCRDSIGLDLIASTAGPAAAYVQLSGVDAYYAELRARYVEVSELADRPYGMRDFEVVDPFGNELAFGEPIAP